MTASVLRGMVESALQSLTTFFATYVADIVSTAADATETVRDARAVDVKGVVRESPAAASIPSTVDGKATANNDALMPKVSPPSGTAREGRASSGAGEQAVDAGGVRCIHHAPRNGGYADADASADVRVTDDGGFRSQGGVDGSAQGVIHSGLGANNFLVLQRREPQQARGFCPPAFKARSLRWIRQSYLLSCETDNVPTRGYRPDA